MSGINWQNVGSIPRTPFTKITVKDANGDLYNLTTDRTGGIYTGHIPFAILWWIPNNE